MQWLVKINQMVIPKICSLKSGLNQCMRKRNYSNVTFVTIAAPKSLYLRNILNQFMRKTNILNVKFVKQAFLESFNVYFVTKL